MINFEGGMNLVEQANLRTDELVGGRTDSVKRTERERERERERELGTDFYYLYTIFQKKKGRGLEVLNSSGQIS